MFAYHNERIYVYVFVCFVFVIYYDLQVHFHVTSYVDQYSLQHFSHGVANAVMIDVFITTPTR